MNSDTVHVIEQGKSILGIELGSTRIKAVLLDENNSLISSGSYDWENKYKDQIWTYELDDVWKGIQESYQSLVKNVKDEYGITIHKLAAIGFSAMMHGYLAFDKDDHLLVPFRTWRNNMTQQAVVELTELFHFNIPQRWSIAHLYQAILNGEEHVGNIDYITTLSGYVHWKLTGQKVLGIGDASGMFPIDCKRNDYHKNMLDLFQQKLKEYPISWEIEGILPKVLVAGEDAGVLTEEGAKLLDVTGQLEAGVPLCPPEGDAGTGMVATNSVTERTGNVSAGTSVFAMIVLEKELSRVYPEIDMVTTPSGKPVAMVHCNNCTSDINAWVGLFYEFAQQIGGQVSKEELFELLFQKALEGDSDCSGLLSYNYDSGEAITELKEGRPLFVRMPDSSFTLANFMRTHLFSALGTLKMGMEILVEEENVCLDQLLGHGGFFKTKEVGQKIMAAAMNVPVVVMETAGEGGAWGIALLASYMLQKEKDDTLEHYLEQKVFHNVSCHSVSPDPKDEQGFSDFMQRYKKGFSIEDAAVDALRM